jgi:hypothetical protein
MCLTVCDVRTSTFASCTYVIIQWKYTSATVSIPIIGHLVKSRVLTPCLANFTAVSGAATSAISSMTSASPDVSETLSRATSSDETHLPVSQPAIAFQFVLESHRAGNALLTRRQHDPAFRRQYWRRYFHELRARQLDLAAVTPRLFGEPRRYASELLAIRQGPISPNMATHSLFALVDNHGISLP